MEERAALTALAALSNPERLAVLRRLVAAEPTGLVAGEIAASLGRGASALSADLSALAGAGLVFRRREGRFLRYRADMAGLRALTDFLLSDCCGGRPELCDPFRGTVGAADAAGGATEAAP